MSNFDSQITPSMVFVDIGNSSIKVAFRRDKKWVTHSYLTAQSAAYEINNHPYPVQHIIMCSVRENVKNALEQEIATRRMYEITLEDIGAETLNYETPETLGIDRYLSCLGARLQSPEEPVVVIDAGSACTIDYMDEKGVFEGGVIMPGLKSMLQVFKRTAPELPEIRPEIPAEFPGKSTTTCLQWGQVGFWVQGIEAMIGNYLDVYGDFKLYLTGGDSEMLNTVTGDMGTVDPNLVFDGMASLISDQFEKQSSAT
tara:strand:- start:45473 stop:46240 length:768 start_codon:yes stop_codon:yes gene_type:complete